MQFAKGATLICVQDDEDDDDDDDGNGDGNGDGDDVSESCVGNRSR